MESCGIFSRSRFAQDTAQRDGPFFWHIHIRTMMAGASHQLTAKLLRQYLSRLGVPSLFRQSPCSYGHEYPDFVFLDPLNVRQVVGDGQQFLFHQKIGGIFRADAVFIILRPATFSILDGLDLSHGQFSNGDMNAKHKPERGQIEPKRNDVP